MGKHQRKPKSLNGRACILKCMKEEISSLNLTLGRRITDEEINETINEAGREIAEKTKT